MRAKPSTRLGSEPSAGCWPASSLGTLDRACPNPATGAPGLNPQRPAQPTAGPLGLSSSARRFCRCPACICGAPLQVRGLGLVRLSLTTLLLHTTAARTHATHRKAHEDISAICQSFESGGAHLLVWGSISCANCIRKVCVRPSMANCSRNSTRASMTGMQVVGSRCRTAR